MIFYSTEARAYQTMTVLVLLSTLALLTAVERGGRRWWVAYAACAALAAYAHYTSVFCLGAQLAWVLWAHPPARKAALLATAGALLAYLPWLPGFIDDLNMPDSRIMSDFSPVTPHTVRLALEHWSVGYPYPQPTSELRDLPGVLGLALEAIGLAIAIVAVAVRAIGSGLRGRLAIDRRLVLVTAMALAAPLGELAASAAGTNLLAARNLAVSWPWFALLLGTILVAAGPRLGVLAAGLVLAGFAIGGVKMTEERFQRPDFAGAAAIIDPCRRSARRCDRRRRCLHHPRAAYRSGRRTRPAACHRPRRRPAAPRRQLPDRRRDPPAGTGCPARLCRRRPRLRRAARERVRHRLEASVRDAARRLPARARDPPSGLHPTCRRGLRARGTR